MRDTANPLHALPQRMESLIRIDKAVFEYLTLYVNPPWLQALSEKIGDLSTYTIPVLIFCGLYYWLNSPRFLRFALLLTVLLLCSEGAAYFLKNVIERPRPAVEWLIYSDAKALGFPSAHAVNSMALAVFASRWFEKSLILYLPIPLVIGLSRILANYHYPLDVAAGWALGGAISYTYWFNILYLGVISNAFATTVYFYAVSKLGSARASSYIFIVPATALLMASVYLHEPVKMTTVTGGLIALIAVAMLRGKN
jgi:membrane-associated phospholipid phosphatase